MAEDELDDGRPPGVRRRSRRAVAFVALATVVLLAAGVLVLNRTRPSPAPAGCDVAGSLGRYRLDLAQAANAATITAVGKREGLPDHAVTVAFAAALLESQLQNLTHGDRDSVGLFQQRPSQGWGSPSQLLTPRYAAAAFYRGLQKVPGWATLAVTDAAQQVQRSAAPDAYAQWEAEARTLAEVFTGEVPAGLRCHFAVPSTVTANTALDATMTAELGTPTLGRALAPARGWTVANWLVAHARSYRITAVSFAGQRWTPSAGGWRPRPGAGAETQVQVERTGPGA